jgi:hypothetical protein
MTRLNLLAPPAIVLCLCLATFPAAAQDKAKISFAKLTPSDFILPNSPIIDSNASAVVLSDRGEVHYIGNKDGWFSYVYSRQTRLKIIDKKAFDLATVKVHLYGRDDHQEKLSGVAGSTYTLQDGQLVQTKLDTKDIFQSRLDKERTEVKLSLPGVKEGAIIEYQYTITSGYSDFLPSWEFQWEKYPCLFSEYQVEIPQTLSFVLVRQGVHPYAVDKGSTGRVNYSVKDKADAVSAMLPMEERSLNVSATTVKHDWVIKDVPAFGEEPFLTTSDNYIDKIDFQLSATYNGEQTTSHTNTWAKATEELLKRDDFGAALEQELSQVNTLADKISVGGDDRLTMAKAVYYYVSRHFTCTDHYDKYIKTNFGDVIRNSSGTVGDINLLLIALLARKGFQADPVVLSTRDYGYSLVTYPMLRRMNYVIVRLVLDGKIYYLDAAHPELGFGQLAGDCYNGPARIISKIDSGSVYFEADSLKERSTTLVMLSATDKGLEGTWQSILGTQKSYETRKDVREHGQQQYFRNIQTRYGDDIEIANEGIDSLSQPEEPVKIHYEFIIKQQRDASLIYLSPIVGDGWRKNPFDAAERKYPVELPYSMDESYILSMEIPQGYAVDELPKSARVGLNGDQGQFEYLIAQQGDKIQMRCRLRVNKAWFPAADYSSLREFFAYVVKKEAEQIVLKKK